MQKDFLAPNLKYDAHNHTSSSYHLFASTIHGRERLRSRGIPRVLVELVILYGKKIRTFGGCTTFFMTRESLRIKLKKIASREKGVWLLSFFKTKKGIEVVARLSPKIRIVTAHLVYKNRGNQLFKNANGLCRRL